jgi:hypothetical protein
MLGRFTLDDLISSFNLVKSLNSQNQIILSTYAGEVPEELKSLVDLIIINKDPGEDVLEEPGDTPRKSKYGYGKNNSRMFETTISGLLACNSGIVIKTRIELIPEIEEEFVLWFENMASQVLDSNLPKIGFFTQHYSGIAVALNGLFGALPDTLQISQKEILINIWELASEIWEIHKNIIRKNSNFYPATSEQILGLAFLSIYARFPLEQNVHKISRYFLTLPLIKSILQAENKFYLWSSYLGSGFSANYFKGTLQIDITKLQTNLGFIRTSRKFCLALAKTVFHHIRRSAKFHI